MKNLLYSGAVIVSLIVITIINLIVSNSDTKTTLNTQAQQNTPTLTVLAKNLEIPWALGFLPDGTILFTERTGKVKLLNPTSGAVTTIMTIPGVKAQAESGLLGLAVHPQFATNNFVYIYYSYAGSGGTQNRVARYTFTNNKLTNPTTIIDAIPGNDYHNGGRLRFGPDGFLYVTTGDGNDLSTPQDTSSLGGKILRVTDNGTAAPGNPFNNRIWSYGHRNPQGIAWNGTVMYATEHGPSQPSCCDELNRIEAGKNYGWPDVKGDETKAGTIKNLLNSGLDGNNTWAPSGTTFYNGSIFFAGLRGQALYEATVQGDSATIKTSHFKNQLGRIRDVVVGPDNMVYIATANKSAQGGSAQPEDDKIIKVTFAGVPTSGGPTSGPQPTVPLSPAPSGVTPTIYCVGGVGAPPCAPLSPGVSVAPTGGSGSITPGSTTPPVGGTNPTTNPVPTVAPCPTENSASVMHNKKKKKKHKGGNTGGFIEQFIKFLLRLIEWLIGGGSFPPPNTGPQPTPIPGDPCPDPINPEQPTAAPEPTIGEQPTVEPTNTATPTLFNEPITAPTATNVSPADIIFRGDFETGNLSQWGSPQACPNGVTIVTDRVRKGKYAAKFTVSDGDTNSKCDDVPTDNPRAQLVSKSLFKDGDDMYIGFSIFFPADFKAPPSWFQVAEIYGPPFGGSPSIGIDVSGNRVGLSRDETHGYDTPWEMTRDIAKGTAWEDFVFHIKFSPDAKVGFVEIWHNGVKQKFKDGSEKLFYATLARGINWEPGGSNSMFINQYRDSQPMGTITIYHDEVLVGKTYESVAR